MTIGRTQDFIRKSAPVVGSARRPWHKLGPALLAAVAFACGSEHDGESAPSMDPSGALPDGADSGSEGDVTPTDDAGDAGGDRDGGDARDVPDAAAGDGAVEGGTSPYAPWLGDGHLATGTCTKRRIEPYSCLPGTPGRDANGCCVADVILGEETATMTFSVAAAGGGAHTLTVQSCTLADIGGSFSCMLLGPPVTAPPGKPFKGSASIKSGRFYLPFGGTLEATADATGLFITFSGEANDTAGRCGDNRWLKTCTLSALP